MKNNFRVYAASFLAAAICFAQQQPDAGSKAIPLSKVERKNKAPVSSDILRVKLPKAVESKLASGLTILVMEDHRLPTVTVRLLRQGPAPLKHPPIMPALPHLTAPILPQGTT